VSRVRRSGLAALAVAVASLALAACGASKHAPASTGAGAGASQSAQAAQEATASALAKLPKPETGVIKLADAESLGITQKLDAAYQATGSGVTVIPTDTSTAQAFSRLCSGRADIAEVTQQPSAAELAQCAANGITFADNADGNPEAFTLAADAIVVATKNEANVGGDCLRRQTLRDIFEPGSSIDNWNQLGFDNLRLTTAGRAPAFLTQGGSRQATGTFPLFANLVLGVEGNATLDDVRSDFDALSTDDDVEAKTTAAGLPARIHAQEQRLIAADLRADAPAISAAEAAAAAKANATVLARIAKANVARAKKNLVLTAAQAAAITTANATLDSQAKARADATAFAKARARIAAQVHRSFAAQSRLATNPGVLGVFRYTYYELYEDKLRPMEIWDPVASVQELQDEGVATSDSDVGDEITVNPRNQAGGGTGEVETVVIPPTPTTPGSKYTSDSKQSLTVPATGPVNVDTTPNCIFPSRQTITSGVYPLSVQLMAYVPTRELRRAEVINYLSYYLGAGQGTVDSQRLVPIDDTTREEEYKALTGHELPARLLSEGASPASGSASTGATQSGSASSGATQSGSVSSGPADISSGGSAASSGGATGQSTTGGIG
jgi:ABC-type phosphate transport system substrate-binding protein